MLIRRGSDLLFRRFLLLTCVLWSLTDLAQEHTTAMTQEVWAESRLSGQPAGYYHEKTEHAEDRTVTLIETDFVMNREGSKVEVKSSSQYEEAADGHLLRVQSDMTSSSQMTHLDASIGSNSLRILTTTGGKTYERSLPVTGMLLGPEAARQLTLARLKSPGDVFKYETYSPEMGSVVTLTNTLMGREQLTIANKQWPSLKLEQTLSAMPGKLTLWLDSTGRILRQVTPTPFGDAETVRSLQGKVELTTGGAALPTEAFSRTVVPANIRLPKERMIEEVKLRITHRKPDFGWPDFNAENQTVLEETPNYVVLEVRSTTGRAEEHRPVRSTPELAPYLAANAWLQSDDASVQRIAKETVGTDDNLLRSARVLAKWTNENMRPDMGVAVAPASEVVRDRRGTCIAYSMLLGSLVRAAEIPSRIRMGFVYVNGAWGGHAWVDVLDGRDWVAMDSALYSPGPVDAARFSAFTSTFDDGGASKTGSFAQLAGNIDIQILEYTVQGKHFVVSEDAPPFTVDGNSYRNPWLGISVTKPRDFKFAKLDAVWPDSTVVSMEGPQHELVEIESYSGSLPTSQSPDYAEYLRAEGITGQPQKVQINGHNAVLVSSSEKAGLVLARVGEVWVIKATGPTAPHLLMQVARTVEFRLDGASGGVSATYDADPKRARSF